MNSYERVLHPGDRKQSLSTALAIFNEISIAALVLYFPDRHDSAQFLSLFRIWWSISNSKSFFNSSNNLGNAAVRGNGKLQFLRAFADWLLLWQSHKLPCSGKFTLAAQTNEARCHTALTEEILKSLYGILLNRPAAERPPQEKLWGSIHSFLVPTTGSINKIKQLNQLRKAFFVRWLPSVIIGCTKCSALGALVTYTGCGKSSWTQEKWNKFYNMKRI